MAVPGSNGDVFTAAFLPDGTRIDGSIHLRLLDGMGNSISRFPCEDLWLESADGGLVICPAGSVAAASTDANGETVDLRDVVWFTRDFHGDCDYRSDFHRDGVIDLLDVTRLVQGQSADCH